MCLSIDSIICKTSLLDNITINNIVKMLNGSNVLNNKFTYSFLLDAYLQNSKQLEVYLRIQPLNYCWDNFGKICKNKIESSRFAIADKIFINVLNTIINTKILEPAPSIIKYWDQVANTNLKNKYCLSKNDIDNIQNLINIIKEMIIDKIIDEFHSK